MEGVEFEAFKPLKKSMLIDTKKTESENSSVRSSLVSAIHDISSMKNDGDEIEAYRSALDSLIGVYIYYHYFIMYYNKPNFMIRQICRY